MINRSIPSIFFALKRASTSPLGLIYQKVSLPGRIKFLHTWGFTHLLQDILKFLILCWSVELFDVIPEKCFHQNLLSLILEIPAGTFF